MDRGLSGRPHSARGTFPFRSLCGPRGRALRPPSSRSSSTDDFCYMFVVELERGPRAGYGPHRMWDGEWPPGPSLGRCGGAGAGPHGALRLPSPAAHAPGRPWPTSRPCSRAAPPRPTGGWRWETADPGGEPAAALAGVILKARARPGRAWPSQSPAAALSLPALEAEQCAAPPPPLPSSRTLTPPQSPPRGSGAQAQEWQGRPRPGDPGACPTRAAQGYCLDSLGTAVVGRLPPPRPPGGTRRRPPAGPALESLPGRARALHQPSLGCFQGSGSDWPRGKKMRLLVAKSDVETARKVRPHAARPRLPGQWAARLHVSSARLFRGCALQPLRVCSIYMT